MIARKCANYGLGYVARQVAAATVHNLPYTGPAFELPSVVQHELAHKMLVLQLGVAQSNFYEATIWQSYLMALNIGSASIKPSAVGS